MNEYKITVKETRVSQRVYAPIKEATVPINDFAPLSEPVDIDLDMISIRLDKKVSGNLSFSSFNIPKQVLPQLILDLQDLYLKHDRLGCFGCRICDTSIVDKKI